MVLCPPPLDRSLGFFPNGPFALQPLRKLQVTPILPLRGGQVGVVVIERPDHTS